MTQYTFRKENNKMRRFKEFCKLTTLHGYSYLQCENDSIALKIFWLIVIMTLTSIGILLLVLNTKQFLEATTITTTETFSAPLNVSS